MVALSTALTHFFPPKPKFTDKHVPDLAGQVFLVTGANCGLGKEVAQLLYSKNAKVYITARSVEKGTAAINDIKTAVTSSTGSLHLLQLDLADLDNVKKAAGEFLGRESRLNVLFNNAGVFPAPAPADPPLKTAQGHELALGVNCVGTLLLTLLLTPLLTATAAANTTAAAVRVVWLSSFGMELQAVPDIGISLDNLDYHVPKPAEDRYGISKVGVWALAVEYARRYTRTNGIVSVPLNPGNLKTNLPRDQGFLIKLSVLLLCYPAIKGAYSELYGAFSDEITKETDWSKCWVGPFGRILPLRDDLTKATVPESEGGTGGTAKFWDWTEQQIRAYL